MPLDRRTLLPNRLEACIRTHIDILTAAIGAIRSPGILVGLVRALTMLF